MNSEADGFHQLLNKLKQSPESYDANVKMGLHLYERGEIDAALERLEQAVHSGGGAELCLFLGALHREKGDLAASGRNFSHALELAPDDFDAQYQYGLHCFLLRDYSKARRSFEAALDKEPDHAELLNDIGVLAFSMGDKVAAAGYLERSLELEPGAHSTRVNLGFVRLALNDVEGASVLVEELAAGGARPRGLDDLRDSLGRLRKAHSLSDTRMARSMGLSERVGRIAPMLMVRDFGQAVGKGLPLSVVVPIYNEEDNVRLLYDELKKVLGERGEEYEIIFVDDGSRDGTSQVLDKIAGSDKRVKVIIFRRNYGQTAALSAGFKYCRGEVVVTLDGDLQNDPADIPMLLDKMAEGYDLVNGWRKDRKDKTLTRKIPSWAANRLINKLIEGTGVQLHDFGCTLKAYKRGIVKNIHLYGEMHRFIPVFAAWLGVEVAEIPVNHRPRIHGTAKYGLGRVWRVIFDLIVVRFFSDYMTRPIQFFGKIAKKVVGYGTLGIALLFACKLGVGLPITYDTLLILLALLWLSGLNIIVMGLTGELLTRSYFEIQDKDHYVVESVLNG